MAQCPQCSNNSMEYWAIDKKYVCMQCGYTIDEEED